MATTTNVCPSALWTQVLSGVAFCLSECSSNSYASEDTITRATMSFKDTLTLDYLERAWHLPNRAGSSLLLWLSSMKTRVSLYRQNTCRACWLVADKYIILFF